MNRKVTANFVQTLMVWKCFWCAGILIYPVDWQSRSISAPALSFWMQRANRDRTWGPWLTPPKINENETSGSAWENERRFGTPLLLHRWSVRHSTEKVLTSDLKVVVWAIFCSYAWLGHSVTIPNTLTSASPSCPHRHLSIHSITLRVISFYLSNATGCGPHGLIHSPEHSSRQSQLSARRLKEIWDNNAAFLQRLDVQDPISDTGRQVLITSSYLKTSNEKCKLEDKANSATDRCAERRIATYRLQISHQRRFTSNVAPALQGEPGCWHKGNFAGHAHTDDLKCSTNEK